jgi:hypothetical protein
MLGYSAAAHSAKSKSKIQTGARAHRIRTLATKTMTAIFQLRHNVESALAALQV